MLRIAKIALIYKLKEFLLTLVSLNKMCLLLCEKKLKNVIVTRVMCAEMLGNSDVRATYTQSSYRKFTGLSCSKVGKKPWGTGY